jgi:hypothetical protein
MAVFTIVVQNAVPFREMGVATSSLTFFRQIGGSIGLALAGTVFGSSLAAGIPTQLSKAGVPRQIVDQFGSSQALTGGDVTSVGVDLGKQILSQVPEQFRPLVQPVIPRIMRRSRWPSATRCGWAWPPPRWGWCWWRRCFRSFPCEATSARRHPAATQGVRLRSPPSTRPRI